MRYFLDLCTLICIAPPICYPFSSFPLWCSAHGDTSCSPFGFPFWLSHLGQISQGLLLWDSTFTSPMGSILPFPWTCRTSWGNPHIHPATNLTCPLTFILSSVSLENITDSTGSTWQFLKCLLRYLSWWGSNTNFSTVPFVLYSYWVHLRCHILMDSVETEMGKLHMSNDLMEFTTYHGRYQEINIFKIRNHF